MQVNEGGQRHAGKADVHPCADDWIQHPCLYGRDHSRRRFDMDKFTGSAVLTVVPANAAPIQRMPAIMDHDLLPDMGRMTLRWL
ncbi:MAG: hypothetical protein K0R61_5073 [Microvirga sp.]|jgi:hypothetical protein|nr:hypothetical protein [Microvirga sp.]